jgi:hypothetical protein
LPKVYQDQQHTYISITIILRLTDEEGEPFSVRREVQKSHSDGPRRQQNRRVENSKPVLINSRILENINPVVALLLIHQ